MSNEAGPSGAGAPPRQAHPFPCLRHRLRRLRLQTIWLEGARQRDDVVRELVICAAMARAQGNDEAATTLRQAIVSLEALTAYDSDTIGDVDARLAAAMALCCETSEL